MKIAPLPDNEAERLEALYEIGILDTPSDPAFDDITRLASLICGTPITVVSLIDKNRQWFKSILGLQASETERDVAFCSHTILQPDLFIVTDATKDERFASNPFVVNEPHIRFYAGIPLKHPKGFNLGTLCVIDRIPRELTQHQQDALDVLAKQVMAQMQLRYQIAQLARAEAERRASEERFRSVIDQLGEGVFLVDCQTKAILQANQAALQLFGYTPQEIVNLNLYDLSSHDVASIDANCQRIQCEGRLSVDERVYRRKSGEHFSVELCGAVIRDGDRELLSVVVRDITDRKLYEERLLDYQQELEKTNSHLKTSSLTDGLTGIKNRVAFNHKLNEEFDRANRYNKPLSLLLLDVDHFKS